jgi:hypothetical protein
MIKAKEVVKNLTGNEWLIKLRDLVVKSKVDPNQPYRIYISDLKLNRTRSQNKYLWGVCYKTISDHTGYTNQELHEIFKHLFCLKTTYHFGNEIIEVKGSTTDFDTRQMAEYIEKVRKWGAEHGIYVPEANAIPDELYIHMIENEK